MAMEEESFLAFLGAGIMLGAVLVLFYHTDRPDRKGKRTLAFGVLLLGELILFPWGSPVEWLRVAVIASVNYVLGADRRVLDGVIETITDLFRRPPTSGGASSASGSLAPEQVAVEELPVEEKASIDAAFQKTNFALLEIVRRMIWPDLPV
ncbi:MAG TPA: hypothetical protein VJ183_20060 [Chloroflexia bacterium]|nr:hypothetical protein [Chloroflexia bacterium]